MAVSKVILNGETLMDVTQDTVTEGTLLTGQTATGADGVRLTGSATVPQPSDAVPQMDGTAAAGTSDDYARADHVHPHDTSKLSGVSLATPSDTYPVPANNGTVWIDIGDGLKVSDSNNRVTLSAKTGTTASTVAAGNHTHSNYQPTLVSGTNIKTVNGESVLGSGDLEVGGIKALTLNTSAEPYSVPVDANGEAIITIGDGLSVDEGSGWVEISADTPNPATAAPLMDGTAAVGTSAKYARENHVHPTDTSRQETLVSGTNIKTVNGNSLLGSGDLTVSGLPAVTASDNGKVLMVVNGAWAAASLPNASGVSF